MALVLAMLAGLLLTAASLTYRIHAFFSLHVSPSVFLSLSIYAHDVTP